MPILNFAQGEKKNVFHYFINSDIQFSILYPVQSNYQKDEGTSIKSNRT